MSYVFGNFSLHFLRLNEAASGVENRVEGFEIGVLVVRLTALADQREGQYL